MLRKVLYTVVILLMFGGTTAWSKPASAQRCVIFLEPIQAGEEFSRASTPVCSTGKIDSVNGRALATSYLIARFYDLHSFNTLLVEYYGAAPCSASSSYGIDYLPSRHNNKFASGKSYSNCNWIHVYDLGGYGGPSWRCRYNDCWTFYSLNDKVSGWRVTYS